MSEFQSELPMIKPHFALAQRASNLEIVVDNKGLNNGGESIYISVFYRS